MTLNLVLIFGIFWSKKLKKIEQEAEKNRIRSIDKVYNEIVKGNDKLSNWVKRSFKRYFLTTEDLSVLKSYEEIIKWNSREKVRRRYSQNAILDFSKADNADPWLIAYALTNKQNFIIVTFEKEHEYIKRRIPIPNVCKEFGIKYCDLYQMLKNLNFRF